MISKSAILGLQIARSFTFTAQQLSLPIFELLLTGQRRTQTSEQKEFLKKASAYLFSLLQKDAENIKNGEYPIQVLAMENPLTHWLRFGSIIMDGYNLSKRRKNHQAHEFGTEEKEYFSEVPDYFKRNYHFQTGGYLSQDSAELYEHQVEILFSGSADAMRRLLIPLVRQQVKNKNWSHNGVGLKFLEIGAGTGRLTKFMKLAFPQARIVCTDLSDPYLKKARSSLKNFSKVDFVQCAGESLPFPDQEFDFVYSCFLFHEIPKEIRQKVVEESLRVLKPNAFMGIVDSIQQGDLPEMSLGLERFPQDFHEPFYKNYIQNPLEKLLNRPNSKLVDSELGFFSKALLAQKTS